MTRPIAIFFFLTLFFTLLSKPYLATSASFIADEFTEIHFGARLAKGEAPFGPTWSTSKTPGLAYLLALPSVLFRDGQSIVLLSRLLMVPIALLCIAALWYTALAINGKDGAFMAVILLCTCTTFIDRSFRLRTDLVSTTCWAWSLYFFLARPKVGSFFFAGFLLTVGFLFTQKAVFFLIAGFFICLVQTEQSKKRAIGEYVGAILFTWLCYFMFFALQGLGWQCITNNFKAAKTGISGFYRSWGYGVTEFWRSPFFWLFGLFGLYQEGKERRNLPLLAASFVLIVLTIIQNSKWPYYYLKLLPTWALLGSLFLSKLLAQLSKSNETLKAALFTIFLFLLLLLPALYRFSFYWPAHPLLDRQLATIAWVEAVTDDDDVVFDGVGTIPTRPRAYRELFLRDLVLYRQGKYPAIIELLREKECKIHIANYRTHNLPPKEKAWLKKHFVHDWGNVFVAGAIVDFAKEKEAWVDLHSSGTFLLSFSEPQSTVLIGEKSFKSGSIVTLAAGKVKLEVNEPCQLLIKYRASNKESPSFQEQPLAPIFATYEM